MGAPHPCREGHAARRPPVPCRVPWRPTRRPSGRLRWCLGLRGVAADPGRSHPPGTPPLPGMGRRCARSRVVFRRRGDQIAAVPGDRSPECHSEEVGTARVPGRTTRIGAYGDPSRRRECRPALLLLSFEPLTGADLYLGAPRHRWAWPAVAAWAPSLRLGPGSARVAGDVGSLPPDLQSVAVHPLLSQAPTLAAERSPSGDWRAEAATGTPSDNAVMSQAAGPGAR